MCLLYSVSKKMIVISAKIPLYLCYLWDDGLFRWLLFGSFLPISIHYHVWNFVQKNHTIPATHNIFVDSFGIAENLHCFIVIEHETMVWLNIAIVIYILYHTIRFSYRKPSLNSILFRFVQQTYDILFYSLCMCSFEFLFLWTKNRQSKSKSLILSIYSE